MFGSAVIFIKGNLYDYFILILVIIQCILYYTVQTSEIVFTQFHTLCVWMYRLHCTFAIFIEEWKLINFGERTKNKCIKTKNKCIRTKNKCINVFIAC